MWLKKWLREVKKFQLSSTKTCLFYSIYHQEELSPTVGWVRATCCNQPKMLNSLTSTQESRCGKQLQVVWQLIHTLVSLGRSNSFDLFPSTSFLISSTPCMFPPLCTVACHKLQGPGLGLAQLQPLWPFWEQSSRWKISLTCSLSVALFSPRKIS